MHKTYEVQFKALPDTDENVGRFTALVSIFGNVDSMGDRVMPGAFQKSLERWRAAGDSIPVIWSHDWGNPFAHIGSIDPTKALETDEGLLVEGEIDLTNAFAAQVHNLMKRRQVKEFSFGYRVQDERPAKDGANELRELDIIEVGPTLKGANPDTQLLGVKSDLEAAARRDVIQDLQERIAGLEAKLDALLTEPAAEESETEEEATSQDQADQLGTDQEPEPKSDDPTVAALADLIAKMGLEA